MDNYPKLDIMIISEEIENDNPVILKVWLRLARKFYRASLNNQLVPSKYLTTIYVF